MKKNKKQQLLREALDFLLCIAVAVLLALAVDAHVKQVVNQAIQDHQRTEWVRAARQATDTVPSLVIPEGNGNNK